MMTVTFAHGTNAGYKSHERVRGVPCRPCVRAHASYNARWMAAHRAGSQPGLPKRSYRRSTTRAPQDRARKYSSSDGGLRCEMCGELLTVHGVLSPCGLWEDRRYG